MKNKTTLLIELKPVSHFFFGGENTFGYNIPGGAKNAAEERNYMVNSRMYPQQSTLLGLLRFLVLEHDPRGLLQYTAAGKPLPQDAVQLIGPEGFRENNSGGYGLIRRISPVFLLQNGTKLLPAALNRGMRLQAAGEGAAWLNREGGEACVLEFFSGESWNAWNAKNELKEALYSTDGRLFYPTEWDFPEALRAQTENKNTWEKPLLFCEHRQIGIQKERTGGTNNEAFFKQSSWKMRPDTTFACYVELEHDSEQNWTDVFPEKTLANFGAERSLFQVKASKADDFDQECSFRLSTEALPADNRSKLVLISDAYVDADIYRHTAFAVTHTTHFRFQQSNTTQTAQYYNLDRSESVSAGNQAVRRSDRFTLIKRGSVFYSKNGSCQDLADELTRQTAFRDIGYNHFVEIPGN